MASDKASAEASIVFERMFTYYLTDKASKGSISLHLKKIEKMAEAISMLKNIHVSDDGTTSVDLRDWDARDIVQTLSKVYDSMIDVSSITSGEKEAFEEAEASVIRTQKQFEGQFKSLGIDQVILKGALRDSLMTGINGLDKPLNGGIPKGNFVLLLGPSGSEKYLFAYQFLAKGLRDGASCLATTSVTDAKGLRGNIAKLKVKTPPLESKGRFKIVDWYSYRKRNIVGVEEDGAVFMASKDISNLDIAINSALSSLAFAPTRRAVMDIVSPALSIYDMATVVELLQREKARLVEGGFTTIIVVEKDAHDASVVSTLKNISNGVLIMEKTGKEITLQIEAMSGTDFNPATLKVRPTRKGLAVISAAVDEREILQDFSDIPGIDEKAAKSMLEFGFTDLERLQNASVSDLVEVPGIAENTARQIHGYVNSIEFTQKLLAKNSRKWLKRGRQYVADGHTDKAIQSLHRALEIDASNAHAWHELAKLVLEEGNEEDARQCYEKAKAADPDIFDPLFEDGPAKAPAGCTVCGAELESEVVACPECGVMFTPDERKKMWGD